MSIITFDVIMHCLCDATSNSNLSSEVFVAVVVVVLDAILLFLCSCLHTEFVVK